jgi:hypothetical protein
MASLAGGEREYVVGTVGTVLTQGERQMERRDRHRQTDTETETPGRLASVPGEPLGSD